MSIMTDVHPLPRYLRMAHWIYEQGRMVSSREASHEFSTSQWATEREFAKIRRMYNIFVFDEQRVSGPNGKKQYMLRIAHIHPYRIDEYLQPYPIHSAVHEHHRSLTWRDLICLPWHELVTRSHQRINN